MKAKFKALLKRIGKFFSSEPRVKIKNVTNSTITINTKKYD
jgi:hypothetical protein